MFTRILNFIQDQYDPFHNNRVISVDFDCITIKDVALRMPDDEILDQPVPGAIRFLKENLPVPDAHGISMFSRNQPIAQIYSQRARTRKGRNAMKKWFIQHGIESEYFSDRILKLKHKIPRAYMTIDRRSLEYCGTFPTLDQVKAYIPQYVYPGREPENYCDIIKYEQSLARTIIEYIDSENKEWQDYFARRSYATAERKRLEIIRLHEEVKAKKQAEPEDTLGQQVIQSFIKTVTPQTEEALMDAELVSSGKILAILNRNFADMDRKMDAIVAYRVAEQASGDPAFRDTSEGQRLLAATGLDLK